MTTGFFDPLQPPSVDRPADYTTLPSFVQDDSGRWGFGPTNTGDAGDWRDVTDTPLPPVSTGPDQFPVPDPMPGPLPPPVQPPPSEAGAIPIMRHFSVATHESQTGISMRSVPSTSDMESTITLTADATRADVWANWEGSTGAFHFLSGVAGTSKGFWADTEVRVGEAGWSGWLTVQAYDDGTGADDGGRIVWRGAEDSTTKYEDWHALVFEGDFKIVHQTNDQDTATDALELDSALGKGYIFGSEIGTAVAPSQVLTFTIVGDVSTGDQGFRWIAPYDMTIVGLQASAGTAPTGADMWIEFIVDGVTAFTSSASILDGENDGDVQLPSTAAVTAGDVLTIEIDQVGSTVAGADVLITLEYTVNAAAAGGANVLTFSVGGELETGERAFRFIAPYDFTIVGVQATCGVAPTGAAVIIDWHQDGTTIFTGGTDRPTIAATTKDSDQEVPAITAVTTGDVLTLGIDQIGSTLPGENLSVMMEITIP